MNSSIHLAERVREIAELVGDLSTSPEVLFHHKSFIEIYEAPGAFAEAAARLYSDPKQSVLHKEITGYAMQRLPLEKFAWLVAYVADLVSADSLPPPLLDKLAFPAFNWGAQLALNYDRPEVRTLLERLVNLEQLSKQRRVDIRQRVLTGATRQDVLDLKAAGQIR